MVKNDRSKYWCLVLYPREDPKHEKALDYIISNYKYAFIEHNKDIDENGSLKKKHTHVVISFNNYKWRNSLSEELEIQPNYLEKVRNLESVLKYLIHFNDIKKYQYKIDDVCGNLKEKLIQYIKNDKEDENDKLINLLDYIDSSYTYISLSSFVRYCCKIGYYDIYRRSASTFIRLIDEHNNREKYH